jgi:acetylornithine deacetylase
MPTSDPCHELLRRLVGTDSVNPGLVPGAAGEQEIARLLAEEMRAIGLRVEVADAAPGRPNVVGVLEGRRAGRSLMLCGHLDTVGVAGMQDPFSPVEAGGCLYGRGAQDMKGGVAAMTGAARLLAEQGGLAAGRLIVAAVADEELASIGAETLVAAWRADAAVVTEPTDLAIGVGHKGFSWVEVDTAGRAAHGSRPDEGRDAILHMGRVLARLEALDRELQARPPHSLLGTASLHASRIEGGRELSVYPDLCTLRCERRTLLGEPDDVALREIESLLAELRAADPAFSATARLLFHRPAYETPPGHPLPDLLAAVLSARGLPVHRTGVTFWTDAAILARAGIPTVLFGPGGAGLHTLQEYVRLDEVLSCRDVLADLARAFCN